MSQEGSPKMGNADFNGNGNGDLPRQIPVADKDMVREFILTLQRRLLSQGMRAEYEQVLNAIVLHTQGKIDVGTMLDVLQRALDAFHAHMTQVDPLVHLRQSTKRKANGAPDPMGSGAPSPAPRRRRRPRRQRSGSGKMRTREKKRREKHTVSKETVCFSMPNRETMDRVAQSIVAFVQRPRHLGAEVSGPNVTDEGWQHVREAAHVYMRRLLHQLICVAEWRRADNVLCNGQTEFPVKITLQPREQLIRFAGIEERNAMRHARAQRQRIEQHGTDEERAQLLEEEAQQRDADNASALALALSKKRRKRPSRPSRPSALADGRDKKRKVAPAAQAAGATHDQPLVIDSSMVPIALSRYHETHGHAAMSERLRAKMQMGLV